MKKIIRIFGVIFFIVGVMLWVFGAIICSDNHTDPAGIAFGVIGIVIGLLGLVSLIVSIFVKTNDKPP